MLSLAASACVLPLVRIGNDTLVFFRYFAVWTNKKAPFKFYPVQIIVNKYLPNEFFRVSKGLTASVAQKKKVEIIFVVCC